MDVKEKMLRLNILPITEEVYKEHIEPFTKQGVDADTYQYYKMYRSTPMFYSNDYLNQYTLDELIKGDKANRKRFHVSLVSRLLFRIQVWRLMYG